MKPYPFLPIVLITAALITAGCGRNTGLQQEPAGTKAEQTTGKGTDTNEGAPPPANQANNKKEAPDKVTIQTWSEQEYIKYSDKGELICQWKTHLPEVIIPDDPEAQYRLNRCLREYDKDSEMYDFISRAQDRYSSSSKTGETWQGGFGFTYDFTVLKNDGRLLSLKWDYVNYYGDACGDYTSYLNSFDTKTGQKLTLDSLAENPEGFKLALRQEIMEQMKSTINDDTISQNVMTADIQNFAFLAGGIKVHYNLYELGGPYTLGSQEFLVPYKKVENLLNDYGKQLASHASEYADEPEIKEPAPDYIFPQSSTAALTGADLLEADPSTLRLARNEIFARHGRKFDASDLQDYFNQKTWYHGEIDPAAFDEGVFNDVEKRNLDLIRIAEEQLKSKEITDSGVILEPNRDYRLDLDGDGICETVRWNPAGDTQDWATAQIELFINGQKQSCIPENLQGNVTLSALDLQKEDKELELHLDMAQDSDTLSSFSFYRYRNGKLEQIADLAGKACGGNGNLYRENGFRADGNGILAVGADTPLSGTSQQFGCYNVDLLFSYKNGKMEEIPQDIYDKKDYGPVTSAFRHDNEWQYYVVSTEFTPMTEMDGNTPAFQARPGETVCPVAWALKGGKSYVLVMNEAGACGWVKELPWDMDPDTAYYVAVPAWG